MTTTFIPESRSQIGGFLFSGIISLILIILASCGSDSPTEPPVIPVDTTGPIVSLINPVSLATIGDTVTLRITSPDSLDIDRVEFRVDNLAIAGGVDSIAPYEFMWTAKNRTDGQSIEFSAQAFDKAGNSRNPSRVTATYRWKVKPAINSPVTEKVIGDTVTISATAIANLGSVAFVEFLVGGVIETGGRDSVAPYSYLWDASATDTSSANLLTIRAVDNNGNSSLSSQVTLHHLWRMLLTDPDESWPRDINTLAVRSTSTQLQFRVTTNGAWADYRSGLGFAVFLDTDQNPSTGATGFTDPNVPFNLNDIGADHRFQIGIVRDEFWVYNNAPDSSRWDFARPLTSVSFLAPDSSDVFELYINLSEIGFPSAVDIIAANILSLTGFSWDFAPDPGNGHMTYIIDGSFSPAPAIPGHDRPQTTRQRVIPNRSVQSTPFD